MARGKRNIANAPQRRLGGFDQRAYNQIVCDTILNLARSGELRTTPTAGMAATQTRRGQKVTQQTGTGTGRGRRGRRNANQAAL